METKRIVVRVAFLLMPLVTLGFITSFKIEQSYVTSYFLQKETRPRFLGGRPVYKSKTLRTNCPIKWKNFSAENGHVKPMINLRRDKYLLPVLINGPNNQLIGFRKSIYIAIHLNRTVVLPKFFKHMSDNEIEAGHRLDLMKLSKLVSFITIDQYKEKCNNTVDAVFRISLLTPRRYNIIERITGLQLFSNKKSRKLKTGILEYPINMTINGKGIGYDTQEMKQLYESERACAIHPFQFSNIKVKEKRPKPEKPIPLDFDKITEADLYSEIIRFTPFPPHIKQLAKHFISDVMQNKSFVSVHWRYDEGDWMLRCANSGKNSSKRQMCNKIQSIKPSHITEGIRTKMKKIEQKVKVTNIYVASPPSQTQNILQVKQLLKQKYDYDLYTSDDVMAHWKGHYGSCDWIWKNVNDLLSSVEMEICSQATVFLKSLGSSWSVNVSLMRTKDIAPLSAMDDEIYKYITMQLDDKQT